MFQALEIKAFFGKASEYLGNNFILAIRSKNPRVLQPIVLFGTMVFSMGLTFISSIITARALGPRDYGDLRYIHTVWSLLGLVITFGYFYSGSLVLVLESDIQKCREISGSIIIMSLIMGLIICLVTVLIAYPLDHIFHVNVAKIMAPLAPLILVTPLSLALPLILQSTNKIYLLAALNGSPSVFYLIFILLLSVTKQISTSSVLLAQQLASLAVIVFVLVCIRPSFNSAKYWWGEIKKQNKTYGSPVYRGALANVGTGYLNRLGVSYWVDNTAIGFFSLASNLVDPLRLLPNAIATSSFRSFATKPKISNRILHFTIVISFCSLVLAAIFFGKPLSWLYTTKFNEVGPMARVLALGAVFVGFGDLFNRFLGAQGKGKSLQNAAYAMGITNVAGALILVPLLGAWGAVMTAVIAGGVYFLKMYLSYRTFCNKNISH